jgi:hypothetical protein
LSDPLRMRLPRRWATICNGSDTNGKPVALRCETGRWGTRGALRAGSANLASSMRSHVYSVSRVLRSPVRRLRRESRVPSGRFMPDPGHGRPRTLLLVTSYIRRVPRLLSCSDAPPCEGQRTPLVGTAHPQIGQERRGAILPPRGIMGKPCPTSLGATYRTGPGYAGCGLLGKLPLRR